MMSTSKLFLLTTALFIVVKMTWTKDDEKLETFDYNCLPENHNLRVRFASPTEIPIVLQLTNHVLNQVASRIFAIYLKEVLGYRDVIELKVFIFPFNTTEEEKVYKTLDEIVLNPIPTINLGVWMPSDHHIHSPDIEIAGPLTTGRFGWFIPKQLIGEGDLPTLNPYTIFVQPNTDVLQQFILDTSTLEYLHNLTEHSCESCKNGIYIPLHCQTEQCATMLASNYNDTAFVIHHINELKLYVNVMWLGDNLKPTINSLLNEYEQKRKDKLGSRKKFLVLHWTPSEVINSNIDFEMISMPRCELMQSSDLTKCKYELTPLLKYYSEAVKYSNGIHFSILGFYLDDKDIKQIFDHYNEITDGNKIRTLPEIVRDNNDNENMKYETMKKVYNNIACTWIKENEDVYKNWNTDNTMEEINIGGIFPISTPGGVYAGLLPAVDLAQNAINANKTILPNINLVVQKLDGQCRPDIVMKAFINYYMRPVRVVGVLGPACSETVEPIAGLSKHFKMAIISYSAEGATFMDRDTYPYFFRTIGENRQYEHVYLRLLKHLNWRRVAALTEDGQKYTEYISHMDTVLKENGIELISNKKFPRYITSEEMSRNLLDLKRKNAFIIIADIYDEVAQIVMCEAYKLQMTAKHGYVWFLPVWLSKNWINVTKTGINITCTEDEIIEMIDGHFSLSHASFAADTAIMQESKTVGEWRESYKEKCNELIYNNSSVALQSEYAGFAYDAVWVYAFALDQLIKEDSSYLSDLHSDRTTKRLIDIIAATDFQGVSGRIQFGEGASRFSVIHVLQWINGKSSIVGTFYPNISDSKDSRTRKLIGGNLVLNKSNIVWLFDKGIPNDGTVTCSIDGFAKLFNIECTYAVTLLITLLCLVFVVLVSIASFMFWKRQYDNKLKQSAKVMRNFGIDLLSPSSIPSNTLDKWEVPKNNVVINRRLGEGAFGTVYGGEAQINENGWTAVAVKTLKMGSSTEDRLDFLSEAEAMKRFDHKNIVKLLGVCLQTEPIYTIMEFMLYGDLKTFLLARRHLVTDKITDDSDVSPKRLTIMALDIARALSYLADNKYVHRDIACRNCLVNAQRVIKLGDFGMARPMFENDYYKFNRKGMLPVRWMAPESLGLGIFTPASDVWSFGVLLYEIITFGSFPFQGLTNNQVLEHIKSGNTLIIPNGVKPHLEGLMKACWNSQYKKRPTASEIAEFISNNPRLVNPCLDVPLASVQMAETDSDQMELLPGLRKRNITPPNGLIKSSTINNFDETTSTLPNGITLTNFNVPPDCGGYLFHGPSNVYNPVEPLLQRDEEVSKSSLSLRRYVPMCGFKRSNRSLAMDTTGLNTSAV